ncbi:Uncharacterised protein [Yersinia pseudotuberculosis]|nr:Uncharacterised protein [Yersinia pseudotuberculosis]
MTEVLKAVIVSILPERLFHFVGSLSDRRLKQPLSDYNQIMY